MTASGKTQSGTLGNQRRTRQPKPDIRRTVRAKSPSSRLPSQSLTRKALVAGVIALAVGLILWWKGPDIGLDHYASRAVDWDDRREEVKEAFISSWDAYSEHAWGQSSISSSVIPAVSRA